MPSLAQQRCFHHAQREAAVRCPGCRRYFCRECVTEHEHRLLCKSCLDAEARDDQQRTGAPRALRRLAQLAAAVALLWVVFFMVGHALLQVPAAFHDDAPEVWDTGAQTEREAP